MINFVLTDLFASVDDIFGVGETAGTWSTDDGVMAWRCVSHSHGAELQKGFTDSHTAQEHLAVTGVAGTILVRRAARSAANTVHVLIAFGRILSKVNSYNQVNQL